MIKNLTLRNFKVFEDEKLELDSLNILSGLNSSGKSSVIQALRILKEQNPLPVFGSFKDFIREGAKGFSLKCEQENETKTNIVYFSFKKKESERDYKSEKSESLEGLFSYISADRYGPKILLESKVEKNTETVGIYGEDIVDFLQQLYDADVAGLQVPKNLSKGGSGLIQNIKEWLRIISPGIDFDFDKYEDVNAGRTKFNDFKAIHVGFGLSYTLPIIASIIVHSAQISAKKINSAIILIENPEAHLHPSGQTAMGKLLSYGSACGLQIIVETHSDHLLNGIRLSVKSGEIDSEKIKCYFFKGDNENNTTNIDDITIDKHGMLDHWAEGFFDESEKNLLELI